MEPQSDRISALVKRDTRERMLALYPQAPKKDLGRARERVAICKPGRESLPETKVAI